MCCFVGGEKVRLGHLDDKADGAVIALCLGSGQAVEMLHPAFRGGVGEVDGVVLLQGHALDFHEAPPGGSLPVEVEPGVAVLLFRLEQGQVRQKVPGAGPLEKDLVGSLGVQVDEPVSLLNGDEVIGRFAVRIPALGQPNRRPGDQQFPAAAGVFHMDSGGHAVQQDLRHKAVRPGEKDGGGYVGVVHKSLLVELFLDGKTRRSVVH